MPKQHSTDLADMAPGAAPFFLPASVQMAIVYASISLASRSSSHLYGPQ
jgi:hypothetical protein